MTRQWIPSSKCCRPGCPMTLCTPIGANQLLCWLHVLVTGLPIELATEDNRP